MSNATETPRYLRVIEAIDALRARKARPDQERIVHWVHRRYGFSKEEVARIIEDSVNDGNVIRVKYKDSISYRNPAKITRGSGSGCSIPYAVTLANIAPKEPLPILPKVTQEAPKIIMVEAAHSNGAKPFNPVRRPITVVETGPVNATKRVLRVIRQIVLSKHGDRGITKAVGGGGSTGTEQPSTSTTSIPEAGASIQEILATLEAQKQCGYNTSMLQKLLSRAISNGAVRVLENGNFILAAGSTERRIVDRKMTTCKTAGMPVKNVQLYRTSGSSLMVEKHHSFAGAGSKMKVAGDVAGKRRFSETSATNSETSSKGKKTGKLNAPALQRARPVSQRKKFKKTLGPDFLEPSELGMPYLQNIFEPMCYVCERPASNNMNKVREEFLFCKDCEYRVHPSCINYSKELTQRCRQAPWQCMYCKTCSVCEGLGDMMNKKPDIMLLCDRCDLGYHMDCHDPPITTKPQGSWACSSCSKGRKPKATTASRFNNNNAEQPEARDDSDLGFDENEEASISSYDSGDSSISEEVIVTKRGDNLDKIFMNLKPSLDEIQNAFPEIKKNAKSWSVEDVKTFIKSIGFADQSLLFQQQEIDGLSLLLLKRSDVMNGMSMKMGPALKIYGHIQRLQTITPSSSKASASSVEDSVPESEVAAVVNGDAAEVVPASENMDTELNAPEEAVETESEIVKTENVE